MKNYINPVPSVDDEFQSRSFMVKFSLDEPVTTEEAAGYFNGWIDRGGRLNPKHIRLCSPIGHRYAEVQDRLSEDDTDPNGVGPR